MIHSTTHPLQALSTLQVGQIERLHAQLKEDEDQTEFEVKTAFVEVHIKRMHLFSPIKATS